MSTSNNSDDTSKRSLVRDILEFFKNPSYHIGKHDERGIALLGGFILFGFILFFEDFLPNNGYTILVKVALFLAAIYFGLRVIDKYSLNKKSLDSLEEEKAEQHD